MKRMWTLLMALCLILIATDGARAISSPSGIDSRLRFEYEVGRTRHGQPEIQGYIYNDYGRAANNVRMIVETPGRERPSHRPRLRLRVRHRPRLQPHPIQRAAADGGVELSAHRHVVRMARRR